MNHRPAILHKSLIYFVNCMSLFVLADRKQEIDEALVNLIVKDLQPFSIVDDNGFKNFVALMDPTYTLRGVEDKGQGCHAEC